MGYQLTTYAQMVGMLSTRLNNSGFWTQLELQNYLTESLRTWQAYSASYTTRTSFSTVPNTLFYNLSSSTNNIPGVCQAVGLPELTPSVTDQQLLIQIQQHLQEPISPSSWIGTPQFTLTQVVQAIQSRRDKFLIETGLGITVSEVPGPPAPSGTLELDDHVIDVRRVMWKNRNSRYQTLWRIDQFDLTSGSPAWFNTPGLPSDYSTVLQQPLMLQISPPPSDIGMVNLFTINSQDILDPTSGPTILGVPDDLSWVVKFGALADLFSQQGPGQDLSRARYCELRWKDGIQLSRITNFVRFGYQDGVPAFIDSMPELDQANPSWVANLPGSPQNLVILANIAAVNPIPDNQPHSLAFDVQPKFPVPQVPSDWTDPSKFVQVGQEILDVIIDYSQHLAHLKEGAEELQGTQHLYQNLVNLAAVQNDRLRAEANNFDVLSDRSLRDQKITKRRNSDLALKDLDYVQ